MAGRFNILSLSGGGFFGLYTVSVLVKLEELYGAPIAKNFDLIAGTSVGGIIALGLAKEVPAKTIQAAFERDGTAIFSNRAAPSTFIASLLDILKSVLHPKYGDTNLRSAVVDIVGDNAKIADLKHPVIIPTVNLTKGLPQIFKTGHHPSFRIDPRRKVVDVAMATSAAPTYFPIAETDDEQQDRWNALARHFTTDLKERSGYPIRTWLQGSYKFGTQIRPVRKSEEFDIDLGIYFLWEGKSSDGKHRPDKLKSFVQDSLLAYAKGDSEDVVEVCNPKPRCGRIRYKDDFHIDVPSYHLDDSKDARTLATEEGWETSDPKAIYLWFKDLFDDATRAKVRRQVRYLKVWTALKFAEIKKRPSSILLTVLVAEAAKSMGAANIGSDDETLRDIVDVIIYRLNNDRVVLNPVNSSENLVRLSHTEMNAFQTELDTLWDIAQRATAAESEWSAADIWQEAFEFLFPLPEETEVILEKSRNLPAPITMPEIRVTAKPRNNISAKPFVGMNRIGPIPKNCNIEFEILNSSALPRNSEIIWIVRNEGREAEQVNDLGHVKKQGLKVNETSAYRGTHFMDCFVKLSGQTIAMRRVPVTIIGQEMPPRNPRKPAWTALRGRR